MSRQILTVAWRWTVPIGIASGRADKTILTALQELSGEITGSAPDRETELRALSRSRLHSLMEAGRVTVNGERTQPNSLLKAGQAVAIELPPPAATTVEPEDRPLEILFEDAHLAIINKPARLSVHPSPHQLNETLVNALLFHVKDLSGIGGELRPGIVHRLDKNTSGALVITKTDACHQRLSEIFSKHQIERRYWALCYGRPKESHEFKVESLMGRNPTDRKKMTMNVRDGRRAITYFKTLEAYGEVERHPFASWVEARLETGRTHQVRVHATGSGFSLLGDPAYGAPSSQQPKWKALPAEVQNVVKELPGQALHARVLGFTHPMTGDNLRFEAEPPTEFQRLLTLLQGFREH